MPDKAAVAVIVPALVSTAGEVTVSNVADVNVPLFVYAAPVPEKVAVGMLMVPVSDLETPVNVCVPVLAVKVPLFVRLPPKATAAAADSLQVAPLFTVTSPVKVLVPVADEIDNVPLVPPPTVVVPDTVSAKAPAVNVAPLPTLKLLPTVMAVPNVVVPALIIRLLNAHPAAFVGIVLVPVNMTVPAPAVSVLPVPVFPTANAPALSVPPLVMLMMPNRLFPADTWPSVTVPDTVRVVPLLKESVAFPLALPNDNDVAAASAVTVTVAPVVIVTVSPDPGTTPPVHVPVAFQLPPVAVLAIAAAAVYGPGFAVVWGEAPMGSSEPPPAFAHAETMQARSQTNSWRRPIPAVRIPRTAPMAKRWRITALTSTASFAFMEAAMPATAADAGEVPPTRATPPPRVAVAISAPGAARKVCGPVLLLAAMRPRPSRAAMPATPR